MVNVASLLVFAMAVENNPIEQVLFGVDANVSCSRRRFWSVLEKIARLYHPTGEMLVEALGERSFFSLKVQPKGGLESAILSMNRWPFRIPALNSLYCFY